MDDEEPPLGRISLGVSLLLPLFRLDSVIVLLSSRGKEWGTRERPQEVTQPFYNMFTLFFYLSLHIHYPTERALPGWIYGQPSSRLYS